MSWGEGGRPLPHGQFLKLHVLLESLEEEAEPLQKVHVGEKKDVFFVVDKEHNLERRAAKKISQFPDDRGAWATCDPSSKTYFIRQGTNLKTAVKRAGVYWKEARQNKVKVFIPLEIQPDLANVVLLQRYCTKQSRHVV